MRSVHRTYSLSEARTYSNGAHIAVAHDVNAEASKRYVVYASINNNNNNAAAQLPFEPRNEHAYEVLFSDQPRRIFVDMEWPGTHPPTVEHVLQAMRETVEDFLRQVPLGDVKPTVRDIQAASASGAVPLGKNKGPWAGIFKHSYHLCYHLDGDVVVRNVADMKIFWQLFLKFATEQLPEERKALLQYVAPGSTPEQPQLRWVFDYSNDRNNQCWRMLHQSKFGSTRVLQPMPGSSSRMADHLVGLPLTQHEWSLPKERFLCLPSLESATTAADTTAITTNEEETQIHARRRHCVHHFVSSGNFPYDAMDQFLLMAQPPFSHRLISTVTVDGKWNQKRYLCHPDDFDAQQRNSAVGGASVHSLRHIIGAAEPAEVHVGAWYAAPRRTTAPILGRELTFDLDLPDYDKHPPHPRRFCECRGKPQVCRRCWLYVEYAVAALHWWLRRLFGFSKIQFYFSGRKGMHCWVSDEQACLMHDAQREMLYQTLLDHMAFSSQVQQQGACADFYRMITEPWASTLFAVMPELRDQRQQRITELPPSLAPVDRRRIECEMLLPQFDKLVTTRMQHNIKIPYSMHATTGFIAVPLPVPSRPRGHEALLSLS